MTEYYDWSGNQSMFYTIQNMDDGYLIVIDGGWDLNAEHVANVIKEKGGVVNAWFLTHYHADHANAFNVLYPSLTGNEGIVVEKIYDSPMDLEQYLEVGQEWDNLEVIVRYYEQTADDERITHLKRDEVLNLDGLQITVLNTYDEFTSTVGDIPNNAALALKIEAANDTVLFMSDVHSEAMSNFLMERYGKALKTDILQPGHHGNNSYNYAIYNDFAPSVMLFDGPGWLMDGETYKAHTLISYCEANGIIHADFRTLTNVLAFDTESVLRLPARLSMKVSEYMRVVPWEKGKTGAYFIYGSSDPGVVVIDENGMMNALAAGSAMITVTDTEGMSEVISVTVQ